MSERLYTAKQAATLLQVSRSAVSKWANQGLITHSRTLGGEGHLRFKLEHINAARQEQGLDPLTEDEAALLLGEQ